MSVDTEIICMWVAVTLYAASAVLFAVSLVFRKERLATVALALALAGIVPHTVAIAGRWVRVGHGPYLGFYEVISSYAFAGVLAFVGLVVRYRSLRPLGVVLMPMAFLAIGGAMLAPKSGVEVSATLASWWLAVHVSFAKLAYGSFITSFGLAAVRLMRARRPEGFRSERMGRLPADPVLEDLAFKFVAAGFIFLGIMIAAGAIWANEAWGRYWGWDPIETWSLISWLVYAVVLHLRLTLGWRGRRFAWSVIAALPVLLFAMVGVAIVYNSIHAGYFNILG
ncbi:MAG: cytochrome c biogenesis protein CcsA [Anaerosomatales bacterium]|nr:cytochrome c biogenesis protein CcsA [Anaerosomatales bacterium]